VQSTWEVAVALPYIFISTAETSLIPCTISFLSKGASCFQNAAHKPSFRYASAGTLSSLALNILTACSWLRQSSITGHQGNGDEVTTSYMLMFRTLCNVDIVHERNLHERREGQGEGCYQNSVPTSPSKQQQGGITENSKMTRECLFGFSPMMLSR
jgi:hypothetical protein